MYKIIGADQRKYGPISAEQIRLWISEGRINANTRIQAEGTGIWKSASEFPEFGTLLPPAPPAPVATSFPTTNSLAIWSLVLSIFSMLCCQVILGPLAAILGAVALSQIKRNPNQTGSGMAIAAIVIGILAILLGVGIIVVFLPQWLEYLRGQVPQ